LRQDLFQKMLEEASAAVPLLKVPARNVNSSWISFAAGPFGHWGLAHTNDSRLRVEAYLDCGDAHRNTALAEHMQVEASKWRSATKQDLVFELLEGRRACRIGVYSEAIDVLGLDEEDIARLVAWGANALVTMYTYLDTPLREAAKQLKEEPDPQSVELEKAEQSEAF
ncbi:MAG: hypothetical protein DI571_07285, partial [Arsenicicoccus sp.]